MNLKCKKRQKKRPHFQDEARRPKYINGRYINGASVTAAQKYDVQVETSQEENGGTSADAYAPSDESTQSIEETLENLTHFLRAKQKYKSKVQ